MYIVIPVNHTCIQHNCNRIYITNYLLSVFVLLLLLGGGAVVLGAVALVAVAASISALNLQ